MAGTDRLAKACVMVAGLMMLPTGALAQSAIGGLVTDTTGAVLPGVTVEAAGPALIEGSRGAVTDGEGRYLIVELRPGPYRVTFTLTGFATIIREGIQLPADFTATVNMQMQVGDLNESVTVTGASPVVDVQHTERRQTMSREYMEALPAGHSLSSRGTMVPAVRTTALEVGASRAMQNTYMSAYGTDRAQTTLSVNGLAQNSIAFNGGDSGYYNMFGAAEVTFQPFGADAETSRGGVRVNMIPREGGNSFSGSAGFSGARGTWQADNFDEALRSLGISSGARISSIYDGHISVGGPLKKDRLWFFGSFTRWSTDEQIANSYYKLPDGSPDLSRPGIDDNYIQAGLARLTWQVSPRHKFGAYLDRTGKFRNHEHATGVDIETASARRNYPLLAVGQARWVWTANNRTLLEAAWMPSWNAQNRLYQPGIRGEPFTPGWYAGASRMDRDLGTRWAAYNSEERFWSSKPVFKTKLTYVTGSHDFAIGIENTYGEHQDGFTMNADLHQEYRRGAPESVLVYNTPVLSHQYLNHDVGLFAQDSWRLDRLTVSGGVRFEFLNSKVAGSSLPAGRFVPARTFPDRENLPNWHDVAPRFAVVYDLFGNAKTALKFTLNRYLNAQTIGFAEQYDPLTLTNRRLPWTDLNRDDIAQGELGCVYLTAACEIDTSLLPTNFGERQLSRPDPDIQRTWNLLSNVGVQHELVPGTAVSAAWIRRSYYDLTQSNNLLLNLSDYTPVTIVNPVNGLPITIYNLKSPSLQTRVDIFDTNAVTPSGDHPFAGVDSSQVYNGFEATFNTRLPGGGVVIGGWTMERLVTVSCSVLDDPNRFRFCNQGSFDPESRVDVKIPYRHSIKTSGNYPLPWFGLRASASFQSYQGAEEPITWNVTSNTRYPTSTAELSRVGASGICTNCEVLAGQRVIPTLNQTSLTVRLDSPGSRWREHINLLDVSLGKRFNLRKLRMELKMDVFNVLNANTILASTTAFGVSYGQPNSIIGPRYLNLGVRLDW